MLLAVPGVLLQTNQPDQDATEIKPSEIDQARKDDRRWSEEWKQRLLDNRAKVMQPQTRYYKASQKILDIVMYSSNNS